MTTINELTFKSNFSTLYLTDKELEKLEALLREGSYYVVRIAEEDLKGINVRNHNRRFESLVGALDSMYAHCYADDDYEPTLADILDGI